MNDEDESKSSLRRALDSLYVKIPELLLAFIGGFGVLIFTLWLSNRDIVQHLADIDEYIHDDRKQMGQLGNYVQREECDAVRATIHGLEIRVSRNEANMSNHTTLSVERMGRIVELEREVRALQTDSKARPDPFTGSDGRVLRDQIDELKRQVRDIKDKRS